MTNDEVQKEAHRIQALFKVPCVIVYSLEEFSCPFGFAIAHGLEDKVLPIIAAKLREVANNLEKTLPQVRDEMKLTKFQID